MKRKVWLFGGGLVLAGCVLPALELQEEAADGASGSSGASGAGPSGGAGATSGGAASGSGGAGAMGGTQPGSAGNENTEGGTDTAGGSGGTATAGGAPDGGMGPGEAGAGGAGGHGSEPDPNPDCPNPTSAVVNLPMLLSGQAFAPSSWFVNPSESFPGLSSATCPSQPAGGSGSCYTFTFQPPTAPAFALVTWLVGTNSGDDPGVNLEPGATKVTFRAWGEVGGETLKFFAGAQGSASSTCADTVNPGGERALTQSLTTTPTKYEFSLAGDTYPRGVIGGFSWSRQTNTAGSMTKFYVDSIQWE